jgi:hypothetical protein
MLLFELDGKIIINSGYGSVCLWPISVQYHKIRLERVRKLGKSQRINYARF